MAKVQFKLWGKIELNKDEQELVKRYRFDEAVLIAAEQPGLLRKSAIVGVIVFLIGLALFNGFFGSVIGPLAAAVVGIGVGYWYFHNKRETIFVKDLLHGRYFSCVSVVELARKEAWLTTIVSFLRQVMESAKHWDGTEKHVVEALPKEEARQVIIRGI